MPKNPLITGINKTEGDNPQIRFPSSNEMLGLNTEDFFSVFNSHRHDGTTPGGPILYGPYLIRDSLGGTWQFTVSTAGVLGTKKVA